MSRRDDPTPVICKDCGWQGRVKDCRHAYEPSCYYKGDVVPVDYCPKCSSEDLNPLEEDIVLV